MCLHLHQHLHPVLPSTTVIMNLRLFLLVQALLFVAAKAKRRTPNKGYCSAYQFGGTSRVHFYSCCNNCDEGSPPSCDGVTYQGASTENYCGPCGKPRNGRPVRRNYLFGPRQRKTAGCAAQTACVERCKAFDLFPGTCWMWTSCFSKCVRKSTKQNGQANEFCGDGLCTQNENSTTCPIDCCGHVDPECVLQEGKCLPTRCGFPSCTEPSSSSSSAGKVAGGVIGGLLAVALLGYVIFKCRSSSINGAQEPLNPEGSYA